MRFDALAAEVLAEELAGVFDVRVN
jgi:hypothetical protein